MFLFFSLNLLFRIKQQSRNLVEIIALQMTCSGRVSSNVDSQLFSFVFLFYSTACSIPDGFIKVQI